MKLIILSILFFSVASYSNNLGLGLVVGDPTGITGKYILNKNNGVSGSMGWSSGKIHIVGSYDYYEKNVIKDVEAKLDYYFGFGGRIITKEKDDEDKTFVGIRIPLGICYYFEKAPFETFLELAPTVDLIPATDFDFDAGIGLRYYF